MCLCKRVLSVSKYVEPPLRDHLILKHKQNKHTIYDIGKEYTHQNTLLKKRLLHPNTRYLFGDNSNSICFWGLRAGWLSGFMFFYGLCALFCLMCIFGTFVMAFMDTAEIGCRNIPKSQWMVIVVNLVKQTWFLDEDAFWYVFFLHVGSVLGILASSCDNHH